MWDCLRSATGGQHVNARSAAMHYGLLDDKGFFRASSDCKLILYYAIFLDSILMITFNVKGLSNQLNS